MGTEGWLGGVGEVSSEVGEGGRGAAPSLLLSLLSHPRLRFRGALGSCHGFQTALLPSAAEKDFQLLQRLQRRRLRTAPPPPNRRLSLSPRCPHPHRLSPTSGKALGVWPGAGIKSRGAGPGQPLSPLRPRCPPPGPGRGCGAAPWRPGSLCSSRRANFPGSVLIRQRGDRKSVV